MKNKKATYLLLVGVLAVWGFAFYQFFSAVGGGEEDTSSAIAGVEVEIQKDSVEKFTLKKEYLDPFFKTPYRKKKVVKRKPVRIKKTPEPDPPEEDEPEEKVDLSFISYHGVVNNKDKNRSVLLVSLYGQQHLISIGDTLKEVVFIEQYSDSLQIGYRGKTAYLKK